MRLVTTKQITMFVVDINLLQNSVATPILISPLLAARFLEGLMKIVAIGQLKLGNTRMTSSLTMRATKTSLADTNGIQVMIIRFRMRFQKFAPTTRRSKSTNRKKFGIRFGS